MKPRSESVKAMPSLHCHSAIPLTSTWVQVAPPPGSSHRPAPASVSSSPQACPRSARKRGGLETPEKCSRFAPRALASVPVPLRSPACLRHKTRTQCRHRAVHADARGAGRAPEHTTHLVDGKVEVVVESQGKKVVLRQPVEG